MAATMVQPGSSTKEAEAWVEFEPAQNDVVSTKVRTWNKTHPGNVYYTALVQNYAAELESDDISIIRGKAEKIVHEITSVRQGRFLKPPDGDMKPKKCVNLSHTRAVAKVIHALRTAISRKETRNSFEGDGPPKKKKKVSIDRPKQNMSGGSNAASSQPTPKGPRTMTPPSARSRSRRSLPTGSIMYKAKAGTQQKLPSQLLKLISAVCNQEDAATAHRVLDKSLHVDPQAESDKDRKLRLQIRHRFAGAAAMGMSPLEFASKLLRLWGGSLVITKKETRPRNPPAGSSNSKASPPELSAASKKPSSAAAAATPALLTPAPVQTPFTTPEMSSTISHAANTDHHKPVTPVPSPMVTSSMPATEAPMEDALTPGTEIAATAEFQEKSGPTPPTQSTLSAAAAVRTTSPP